MEFLRAFVVGGIICVIGQVILDNTKLTPAHVLVSFLTLGVILGAMNLYEPLVKFAGAGATVPILGFGNTLARGAIDGAKETGIIGAFTGGITAASGGIAGSILFGYIIALLFKPKTKS